MHAKRINALLAQEGGCKMDDLLREEDIIINAFKLNSVPKLIAFTCERENIQKLIQYAIKFPQNPDNTEQTHKFPFYATDILSSNNMILQALCEGGWSQPKDEPESDPDTDKKTDDDEFDADRSENKMV
jgi:hypothetical protein